MAVSVGERRGRGTLDGRIPRVAGIGGLVFLVLLVIQNGVRSSAPTFDASPADVVAYFADHRTAAIVPLGLFPLGMVALLGFAAGIWVCARGTQERWWAGIGALAVVVVAGLFGVVNVIGITLTAEAGHLAGAPGVVRALWAIHAAAFGLNLVAIGLALVGLSRVAVARSWLPRWYGPVALVGATCLVLASVFTVAIVDGGAWLYLGFVGFVIWGVFLLMAGVSMLRATIEPAGAAVV